MPELVLRANCPICIQDHTFGAPDDYWNCRTGLKSETCGWNGCIPRHRAMAQVLFTIFSRATVRELDIHESSPGPVGLSYWLRKNCARYVMSGYFPTHPFGQVVNGMRNEDLERQTFSNGQFDLVLHLDVMEHLFNPFAALREIHRTLKPGGHCLFTAPTYPDRAKTEQVAFREANGIRVVGKPEYHGNPQDSGGSIVTWRYGYDLPYLISTKTGFDVEVRRWYSPTHAILGTMTEVYILSRRLDGGDGVQSGLASP